MTQHIGIVAGSAEGAALCYRTICMEAPVIMGEHNHPEITMNSIPMAAHMPPIRANDWKAVDELMAPALILPVVIDRAALIGLDANRPAAQVVQHRVRPGAGAPGGKRESRRADKRSAVHRETSRHP